MRNAAKTETLEKGHEILSEPRKKTGQTLGNKKRTKNTTKPRVKLDINSIKARRDRGA